MELSEEHEALRTVVFWVLTILTPIAVFVSSGYVMGALFAAMAFFAPTANTTIQTYELLLTPDALRGRVSGVSGVVADPGVDVERRILGHYSILCCQQFDHTRAQT